MTKEQMRFRLQRKETVYMPNILGNCSQPVCSYRWKDIAVSGDRAELEKYLVNDGKHRIIEVGNEQ